MSHQKKKEEYEKLKKELAVHFRNDREAYTKAKAMFVQKIVAKAL